MTILWGTCVGAVGEEEDGGRVRKDPTSYLPPGRSWKVPLFFTDTGDGIQASVQT